MSTSPAAAVQAFADSCESGSTVLDATNHQATRDLVEGREAIQKMNAHSGSK